MPIRHSSQRSRLSPAVTILVGLALAISISSRCFADAPQAADDAVAPDTVIDEAFARSSQGFSSDELLVRDDLRADFLKAVAQGTGLQDTSKWSDDQRRQLFLRLLGLRKAGKLTTSATRRAQPIDSDVQVIAEMAGRAVMDRHRMTTDQLLADPRTYRELTEEARKLSPDVDAYAIRRTLLRLRKTRRLRPELVLQVADWQRKVTTYSLDELKQTDVPKRPGVYLFKDASGYLYIGEAVNLAERLKQHFDGSHNAALAAMLQSPRSENVSVELHVFAADSPASKSAMRRAYESELIRSRSPKYNVRP
ncbi:hypothetical protein V7x_34770 [Crateriforma conspicua]|uniref:GIY-YIG domain-containing protein n=1 Tax=Crateriforma conspicua TaxID=2527996 RepID=A0A5C6FMC3_9PLAN|nr:hypothetical protein V7x_34770 [Crateriforma conspicua]